jgi:hypothetical protein
MRRWGFITSGFKDPNIIGAGQRVTAQATKLGIFTKLYNFNEQDLELWAPETFNKYRKYLNTSHKGFGYWAWKPELIKNVMLRNAELDGVLWVDSGCEIFSSPWTKKRIVKNLERAEIDGYLSFHLNYPEKRHTKIDMFELVGVEKWMIETPQIQATTLALFGDFGRVIAKSWFSTCISDIHYIDNSPSLLKESAEFIEHRYDQSALSLTMKKMNLPSNFHAPAGGVKSLKSGIKSFFDPIWTCRNRTGITSIPKMFLLIANFFNKVIR